MVLVELVFGAALLDLLRRLFRNVARGESFTARNIRLVHVLGISILAFTLLSGAMQAWYSSQIVAYLNQHAAVEGGHMSFASASSGGLVVNGRHFDIPFSGRGILTGLLVLALGEVFRQGLVLKQENDLTI